MTALAVTPNLLDLADTMLARNGIDPLDIQRNRAALVEVLFWWLTVQRQALGEDVGGYLLPTFERTPLVRAEIDTTMQLAHTVALQLVARALTDEEAV